MTLSTRRQNLYQKLLDKRCKSVRFEDLCSLLEMYDWVLDRIAKNSHYIYVHSGYEGIVNIPKPHKDPHVKLPYCRHALRAIQEIMKHEN